MRILGCSFSTKIDFLNNIENSSHVLIYFIVKLLNIIKVTLSYKKSNRIIVLFLVNYFTYFLHRLID